MKQKTTRRKFTAEFKAKVALEAIKDQQTLSELSRKFEVSPVIISRWKGEFLENAARFLPPRTMLKRRQKTLKNSMHKSENSKLKWIS